jgi:TolB-like protein/predicted negative regulator of RcsB-dependent stress response
MRLRGILAELRHRGVLKVATVYLASGVVVLEAGSHLLHNFEAPHWVVKVFTALVIFGFPIACLMAWGFEFKDGGVHPAPPMNPDAPAKPGRADAFLAGLLLLVLGLLAVLVVQQWRTPMAVVKSATTSASAQRGTAAPARTAAVGPPSIAVLPFADMSAEHDQQYLGDGIAEELLNALSAIHGLNVAARTSSFSFAGKGASIKEIGDTLHVRHVLEGSVRRSGQKLRVTAQLIDVDTGFHLYSQSYDREVKDIFEIQNEIAREIVVALLPKLGLKKDASLVKQGTTNLEAYNLRLKAHQWLTNPDPKQVNTAIEQLQRATALDPNYGDAWGDLSYVHAYSAIWARDPIPSMMKASSAASIALVYSPSNVPALLTQAYISTLVHRDFVTAATFYEKARAAGVDQSVWAFNKAYWLHGPLGHFDASIGELEDAERRDPLALTVKFAMIEMYLAAGETGDAVATAERMLKLSSTMPGSIAYAAYAYLADGNVQRAEQLLAQLRAETGDDFWHVLMIQFRIDAATGRREDARQLLDRILRGNAAGETVSPFVIGIGYRSLGDTQQAIDWWKRAVEQHHPHGGQMSTQFRGDPVIGKDPRFLALLKRMGLEGDGEAKAAGQ